MVCNGGESLEKILKLSLGSNEKLKWLRNFKFESSSSESILLYLIDNFLRL